MEDKTYTLRGLEADDTFLVTAILNKIGMKELKGCMQSPEVLAAIEKSTKGEEIDLSAVGVSIMLEVASIIIAHLGDCKNEIYALLAALTGMKESEIGKLPFRTFIRMIREVITKPEFADFFQDAFGSPNSVT